MEFFTNLKKYTEKESLKKLSNLGLAVSSYLLRCAIWYHLYNFKNVKNTHGGVLVKFQAFSATQHVLFRLNL